MLTANESLFNHQPYTNIQSQVRASALVDFSIEWYAVGGRWVSTVDPVSAFTQCCEDYCLDRYPWNEE